MANRFSKQLQKLRNRAIRRDDLDTLFSDARCIIDPEYRGNVFRLLMDKWEWPAPEDKIITLQFFILLDEEEINELLELNHGK